MHPLEKIYPPGNPKLCRWWWFTGLHLLCWTLLLTILQLIQPPLAYLLHCSPHPPHLADCQGEMTPPVYLVWS